MAISALTVFEVRSNATAGNVNGGGFVTGASGVDYSQQTGAQYPLTGVTSAGAGDTVLSASAAADMVGNLLRVVSGTNYTTTNPWFEILSVVPGVSITCGTNAAGASISTGIGINGVMNIGGALSLGSTDDTVFEQLVAGNKMWIKNGTYTLGGTVAIAAAGGAQKPIVVEGYNSQRNDKPTGSTRPTLDAGAVLFTAGANWDWYNLIFTGSATTGVLTLGASNKLVRSKVVNTTTSGSRVACTSGANTLAFGCEFVSYRGIGVVTGSSMNVIGCFIHDCDIGVQHNSTSAVLVLMDNIIASNVTAAVHITMANTARSFIYGNTLYGSEDKLGIGVNITTGTTNLQIMNNIIYGFATGVNHPDVQTVGYDNYNNYFNNTADVANWVKGTFTYALNPGFVNIAQITGTVGTTAAGVLTDTSKDFSNVVDNQDYIYIVSGTGVTAGKYLITAHSATSVTPSPAPGNNGTADKVYKVLTGRNFAFSSSMKNLGFPGAFPGGLTVGYKDIGGVQKQIPARPTAGVRRFGS